MVMDSKFYHDHKMLVDNTTLLTQLTVMTAFYGINKTHDAIKVFSGKDDQHVQ